MTYRDIVVWILANKFQGEGGLNETLEVNKIIKIINITSCHAEFLISSYGAPFAQRASYLALHSSLFGPDGAVNYDYIVNNSITSLLIGSKCIPNGAHTNQC